jgi:hypothetical protein
MNKKMKIILTIHPSLPPSVGGENHQRDAGELGAKNHGRAGSPRPSEQEDEDDLAASRAKVG